MKLIDRDPFSNGTEHMRWEELNCDHCWKSSRLKDNEKEYTKVKCAIQRDIFTRMMSNQPISQRTIDICSHADCPYRQEQRPTKRYEKYKNDPKLFEV